MTSDYENYGYITFQDLKTLDIEAPEPYEDSPCNMIAIETPYGSNLAIYLTKEIIEESGSSDETQMNSNQSLQQMMTGRVTEKNRYHMVVDTDECTPEDKLKQPDALVKIGGTEKVPKDKNKEEVGRENRNQLSDSFHELSHEKGSPAQLCCEQ